MPNAARDPSFEQRIRGLAAQVQARSRYHSIELPDGSLLPGLQSVDHLRWRLGLFNLPEDLSGKRVLDIGAWDGWFSFECEKRGARVVAVDCVRLDTFLEARDLIGSRVEYLTLDVQELSAAELGRFDIVLFFGVLYHLRHPLEGLEKVVELSTDLALIESHVIPSEQRPVPAVIEYYERAELGGQIDNWCGPTPEALLALCRSAGFAQAELLNVAQHRAAVLCRRHWPAEGTAPAPELRSAVNNRTWEPKFHPRKDEYLCCFFRAAEQTLTADDLYVEVDGFGTQTLICVADGHGGFQANCLRPPGLAAGTHQVTLRTIQSRRSNSVSFTMLGEDAVAKLPALPLPRSAPELASVQTLASGDLRLSGSAGGAVVIYFRSPASALLPSDIEIEIGNSIAVAASLSTLENGVWQANVNLPKPVSSATLIRIRLVGGEWSEQFAAT